MTSETVKEKNTEYEYKLKPAGLDRDLVIKSAEGIFSPRRADKGTEAMLCECRFEETDNVLDLGCGAGIVGITAAICGAKVTMCDIDPAAVNYSALNVSANLSPAESARISLLVSDAFENITETGFTKILSNPPYHTDFSVARRFIEGAFSHLCIGGVLYMVTKRLEWYKNKLSSVFGGVKVKEDGDGYFVFRAEKRGGTPYNANKSHSLVKFRAVPDGTDPSGALDFVLNVFQKSLAPVWAEEGINTFNNLIDHARILPVFRYFEAYDDIRGKTVGILAADNTLSHLSLLFVDAAYRSRGIGKRLVELLERESSSIGLSVNAEPSALPFYLKLGFHPVDPGPEGSGVIDEKDGIRSVKLYKKIKRDKNKGQVITPAANADDRT